MATSYVNNVMREKFDGVEQITYFYELDKNSIDVLFLGSSAVFANIRPNVLWENYGIRAYCLGASMQSPILSYYYFKEALKYQKPKLLVFEIYGTSFEDLPYLNTYRNISGMKLSANKLGAIKNGSKQEYWLPLLFNIPRNTMNGRITPITKRDFLFNEGKPYNNGAVVFNSTQKFDIDEGDFEARPIADKSQKYLFKILKLAEKNNIRVLLLKTPAVLPKEYNEIFTSVELLVRSMPNVKYLNLINKQKSIGINGNEDFSDVVHLNEKGALKVTTYVGKYIKENYPYIDDSRKDKVYERWNVWSKNF